MGLVDPDLKERVREASDIVDVAQGYFPLTRRGERFFALCPFHREKSPSFSIHSKLQIFHCFGCRKSGDVFNLVMELDRMTFPEALRELAQRAGIVVESGKLDRESARRLRLYHLMQAAEEFYVGAFHSKLGGIAREYAAKRGLDRETLEKFGIGYAPDEWTALTDAMRSRGYHDDELLAVGLSRQSESKRTYDLMRGRLVIPIRDPRGKVVGFGGRILGDGEPKYLNSPETELFSKRTVMFAFNHARNAATDQGEFLVVEGYMDAIAAHQHGIANAVGTLGTALTREHAHQMLRYAKRALLLFDADEAGRRAADRGAPILLQEGLDVSVASLPSGLDPDDYLRTHDAAEFGRELSDKAEDLLTFLVRRAREKEGSDGVAGAADALREVLSHVSDVRDPIRHDLFLTRIAQQFGLEERVVRREAGRQSNGSRRAEDAPKAPGRRRRKGYEIDELYVLLGGVTDSDLAKTIATELSDPDFRDPVRRRVFNALKTLVVGGGGFVTPSLLLESLKEDHEAYSSVEEILGCDVPEGESSAEALQRILRRRQEVAYRETRDEAARSGVLRNADDDDLDRKLAELARFHASRYARSKDIARGEDSSDSL